MKTASIALTFIWCGLVLGLSFIETPLKFQAPDITRELGLGIGQLVFNTLNRIEWFFSVAMIVLLIRMRPSKLCIALFAVSIVIVLAQTFVLLPKLDVRVELIRGGNEPADSPVHWIYIAVEIVKLLSLFTAGVLLTRHTASVESPAEDAA